MKYSLEGRYHRLTALHITIAALYIYMNGLLNALLCIINNRLFRI